MKMIITMLVVSLSLLWPGRVTAASLVWQPLGHGLNEATMIAIAVTPQTPHVLYAASPRAVYVSGDGGAQWQERLRVPPQTSITFLAIDPFDGQHAVAATTNGLYGSADGGRRWKRLFRGVGAGESFCQVAVFHPLRRHEVLLGTAGGLFLSSDGGRSWKTAGASLTHHAIHDLAIDSKDPERVYALTDRGLYASGDRLVSWQRLFETTPAEEGPESPEDASDGTADEQEHARQLTAVAVDPQDPQVLYLASSEGLFVSPDRGASWQSAPSLGLGTVLIQHLAFQAHSPTVVYAATPYGIARYRPQDQRWDILYAGLPTQRVQFVAATDTKVYAATTQGLYMLDVTPELMEQGAWPAPREILADFVHEPTIEDVQEQAIRYAEVHPDKIKQWRRQAALKALLPKVSLGYDRDQDTYVTSMGSTTNPTFDRLIKTEDPSHSTDLSISWDLGELIWNDDQTSIDVRSKLMVQLRDDILDEVTRTYFERRRLQVELLTAPPADPSIQLDKELRLQELTAMLDGLTGGWFSKQLEQNMPR